MQPQTVARLAAHKHIVAIKEATGSLDIASEILTLADIRVISGDDSLTLPLMSIGGRGVISVVSNLMPDKVKQMVDAALGGRFTIAQKLHMDLFPLFKGMLSLDTNPIPIKAALAAAGRDTGELRLPLVALDKEKTAGLERLLQERGLI